MTDATELDLDAVRARLNAATEGPWRFSNTTDTRGRKGEFRAPPPHNGFMLVGPWTNDADAEFIANARTDVEALADEVERLRAGIEAATARANDWMGTAAARENALRAAESSLAAVRTLADEEYGSPRWGLLHDGVRYIQAPHLLAALAPTSPDENPGGAQ